jgi:O-antigen biosynthesis protein
MEARSTIPETPRSDADSSPAATRIAADAIAHGASQKERELAPLLDLLAERRPRCVVEIGTARGGSFYAWCQVAAPDAVVVSIDLPGGPFGGGYSEEDAERFREFAQPGQDVHFLRRDSHDPGTVQALQDVLEGRRIDFLFIDGDHAYYGVRKDFDLYSPLVADDGLIAFHDVFPHREVPEVKVDVLWRELKGSYEHLELVDPNDDRGWGPWGGIGVLFNPPRRETRRSKPVPLAVRSALMADVARAREATAAAEARTQEAHARAEAAERERQRERRREQRRVQKHIRAVERERDKAREHVARLDERIEALERERDEVRERLTALARDLERERDEARDRLATATEEFEAVRRREELERDAERARVAALEAELENERRQWESEREATAMQVALLADEAERGRQSQAFLELVFQTRGWRALEVYRRARSYARSHGLRATLARRRTAPAPVEAGMEPMPPVLVAAGEGPVEPEQIALEPSPEPTVTIVIPVYENAALTLRCLASVAAATASGVAEVIVVDDASSEETHSALLRVKGLRVVRNDENLGFVGSCNRGAAQARGEYLVFLNNDTEVMPGWLDALLGAVRSAADVGAVGSKLVYPHGGLQEAGGVIWSDASGLNVGRGDDPEAPEYNFRRDADYCSAAALLVRRDLFERLGGFDERFAPGYYEDTDLCFALREEGFRTLYEPGSVVVHDEGGTHGTDDVAGLPGAHGKASQYRNRHVFRTKWAVELSRHWPPGTAGGYRGGRIERRPHVLVVDTWVPAHDRDSGSLRMTWILRLLRSLGCAVTLFPLNRERREPYATELQQAGVEVYYGPRTFSDLAAGRSDLYDLVVLSRPNVAAELLDDARVAFPRAVILYDTVDLHFLREQRRLELTELPETAEHRRARDLELDCIRRSDVVAAITEDEARVIREQVPAARTVVLPNVHELDSSPTRPFSERADLLFIGGFQHEPNVDSALFLVEEVLPLLAAVDARLLVLGSDPPDAIRRLQSPRVIVTGYLPDVDEYFRRARVFVAPLRYGAGMKGKIGHALAFGLPVVTTPIGAEGMGLVDDEHALIRNTADELAEAVLALYDDEERWTRLSEAGRDLVWTHWTPAAMRARLEDLLRDVVQVSLPDRTPVASPV